MATKSSWTSSMGYFLKTAGHEGHIRCLVTSIQTHHKKRTWKPLMQ